MKQLKPYLISDDKRVDDVVEKLLPLCLDKDTERHHAGKARDALNAIILNLIDSKDSPVAYSRDKNKYSKQRISYVALIRTIDWLEAEGFLNNSIGSRVSIDYGELSEFSPTPKLLNLLSPIPSEAVSINLNWIKPVTMKDAKGNYIELPDNQVALRLIKRTQRINQRLHKSDITLDPSINSADSIDLKRKYLTRQFNNSSLKQGGRFYRGWWIDISGKDRKHILIDGSPTIELDYANMVARVAYGKAELAAPEDDSYEIDGIDSKHRGIIKDAFSAMLNTDKASGATAAIKNILLKHGNTDLDASSLRKVIEEKHEPIAHLFYNKRTGMELMNIDSNIAEHVLINLDRKGITCLPVHDSFIVKAEHEEQLHEEMEKAFEKELGQKPKVRKEH